MMNDKIRQKTVRKVGGVPVLTRLIEAALRCSHSKATKIAGGRYPSLPMPVEREILAAKVFECSEAELFPCLNQGRNQSAS